MRLLIALLLPWLLFFTIGKPVAGIMPHFGARSVPLSICACACASTSEQSRPA